MKYPQRVSWLARRKIDDFCYEVTDYKNDNAFRLSNNAVHFLQKLDGKTDPFSISTDMSEVEVKHLLRFFKREKLIRYSRVEKSFLSLQISLFNIKCTKSYRAIAFILNSLLMISFLPVFVLGVSVLENNATQLDFSGFGTITGSIFGMIIGLILHEIGHALAAAGYNARLFEVGIIIGLVSGAYVALDYNKVKRRFRRVQILSAGIEMNLLLTGISCILSILIYSLSSFFFAIALANFILAVINMLCISGSDGCSVMEELIESESILFNAIDFAFDKKLRNNLIRQGDITSWVKIASSFIGAVCQLAYPLLIIANISGVILCLT